MLTEELLKKVRQLEIYTNRTVNETFAGEYSSAFKGRGMEFAEVRAYQPGDDIRTIDWNVTARSGEPHVKRFVEERELTILLAVDLSASGDFGSIDRPKNETAAELAAVLAFAAIKNNDKVGLLIFTDRIETFLPPKKGKNHALRIVRELLNFEPAGRGTDLTRALDHLVQTMKRQAVVFLVSDFLSPEVPARKRLGADGAEARRGVRSPLETSLRHLARRHDVVAVSIADPRERELPRSGLVELEDAETGRRIVIDASNRRVRERYEAVARERESALRDLLRRCGADSVNIVTHEPYIHHLIELFRRRERRR